MAAMEARCNVVWVAESGLTSYEISTRSRNNEFPLASSFFKVRVGGARPVMTVGECHVESISNRFALVHSLLWKAKRI